MAETLGSLLDKLSICNIRLWHLEDRRRDMALSDAERLKAGDLIAVENKKRNALVDEIDELADKATKAGAFPKEPKNKLY